jgi:hypothetical protein
LKDYETLGKIMGDKLQSEYGNIHKWTSFNEYILGKGMRIQNEKVQVPLLRFARLSS